MTIFNNKTRFVIRFFFEKNFLKNVMAVYLKNIFYEIPDDKIW